MDVRVADIMDLASAEVEVTVASAVSNMDVDGLVEALRGVYDHYLLEAEAHEVLSGLLPFPSKSGADLNGFASAYGEAVSATDIWLEAQDAPSVQDVGQKFASELSSRFDTSAVDVSFNGGGTEVVFEIAASLSQTTTEALAVDLSGLEDLSGQDLAGIPEEYGTLSSLNPVQMIELASQAQVDLTLNVNFSDQGAQAELIAPSTVTLEVSLVDPSLSFDGAMGVTPIEGITGSIALDLDGNPETNGAATYTFSLGGDQDVATITESDLTVTLTGAAGLEFQSADWNSGLSIEVPDLQSFVTEQSGSVVFATPTPDFSEEVAFDDEGVENGVFESICGWIRAILVHSWRTTR